MILIDFMAGWYCWTKYRKEAIKITIVLLIIVFVSACLRLLFPDFFKKIERKREDTKAVTR
jgi:hypothetical protein